MEKIQPSACSVANNEKGSPDTGLNIQNCPSAGSAPSKPPLVILTGPTAVGKTALSVALAKAVNGEIISADSMQVYRRMDVGSAKVRTKEMQGIRHHLIDVLDPDEDFNVVLFQKDETGNSVVEKTGFDKDGFLENWPIDFFSTERIVR